MGYRAKVLDLDILNLPDRISGLEGYGHVAALIRCGARPLGMIWLNVIGDSVAGDELYRRVVTAFGRDLWELVAEHLLLGGPVSRSTEGRLPITVAVCTHERPEDLRRCLDALVGLPRLGDEVMVIDNCPATDATRDVTSRYPHVRYIREDARGLSCARNRALLAARHDVIAFTDDDAVPDAHWLGAVRRNFDDPLVACVTGMAMPLELETEAQQIFERFYGFSRRGFRRREVDISRQHPLFVGRMGAGVNMALRRSRLNEVGRFDPALGPGTPCESGDDHELFARILLAGYRIVYDPEAIVWHRHRRTREELERVVYGYGVGSYAWFTRSLLVGKEVGVLKLAFGWFLHEQLPALLRALLRRSNVPPLDLVVRELMGCVVGPWAYLRSRRNLGSRRNLRWPRNMQSRRNLGSRRSIRPQRDLQRTAGAI